MTRITRSEYVANSSELHTPYYLQLVNSDVLRFVMERFPRSRKQLKRAENQIVDISDRAIELLEGEDRVAAMRAMLEIDPHLNMFSLDVWDPIVAGAPIPKARFRELGDSYSESNGICVVKAAVRALVHNLPPRDDFSQPVPEPVTRVTLTPAQIAEQTMDHQYGEGSDWGEENQFGERGFTRAQAETDINAADIQELIEQAIARDREQFFDTTSSISVQHYIDHGRYLTHQESALTPSAGEHLFVVNVWDCSAEEAETVITERIGPDEDYGFPYRISWNEATL